MVSACRWDAADLRSEARGTALFALQEAGQFAVDVNLSGVDGRLDPVEGGADAGDVLVEDDAFVVAELPVTQAWDDAAGRGDERVAGGDQVEELHGAVDRADRGGDGAVALEVLTGLLASFDLGAIDLVAGGVVAHRLERNVRPAQETGGHLGGDGLVPGQFLDDLHLVGRLTLLVLAGSVFGFGHWLLPWPPPGDLELERKAEEGADAYDHG